MIGFDESYKLCWKHEMILFQLRTKGIYISNSISDLQYKSGDNIDIYVHIVASLIQLIYTL